MMKKKVLLTGLFFAFAFLSVQPVNAGIITNAKDKIAQNRQIMAQKKAIKQAENDIRNTFLKQNELSNKNDIEGLKSFYAENYRNADGFSKDVTFKIIKDNCKTYPQLKTDIEIKNIDVRGDYALVDIYETADMDGIERDDVELKGHLQAFAHTIYYLKKTRGKWIVTSEHTVEENNAIIFGEAQYLDLKLTAPMSVPSGEVYDTMLSVNNIPRKAMIMASISKTPASFPIKDGDDTYRVMEDTELERIFTANKDNVNEYVVSSVGITRAQPIINNGVKLYMRGLAFLITTVNIIPENKFVDIEALNTEDAGDND